MYLQRAIDSADNSFRRSAVLSRLFYAAALLLLGLQALAQSADQQVVSVVDAPDPVIPGQNVVYTVTMRNNGPNAAVNGGLNAVLASALGAPSFNVPAGFSCATFGANLSCTNPSFAPGTTAVITITAQVAASLLNFPDGTFSSFFYTSGLTPDPVNSNNETTIITSYDSPQIDLATVVSDAPDPVGPNQNISYTVLVSNAGPDNAQNVNFNVFNNGSLKFQSALVSPGFSCALPALNGTPTFTCNAPTLAPGNYNFTVVVRADPAVLGINDGSVSTAFGTNGIGNDTNQANNNETETTAYVTPKANLSVAVIDTPDPAIVGQTIDFHLTVANAGPDSASATNVNMFNNGSLRFQAVSAPPGFSCAAPAVGATPTFTCTNSAFASGQSVEFIISVKTDASSVGATGGTVLANFSVNSGVADPVSANNSADTSTVIVPDLLFKNGFE